MRDLRNFSSLHRRVAFLAFMFCVGVQPVSAERVKDLASVGGVRNNQLAGYGLVVGLNGTGDQTTQTPFTVQSVINILILFLVTGIAVFITNSRIFIRPFCGHIRTHSWNAHSL